MNLRNAGRYNIGLDIGTGSVGWAVTDADGNLFHFKGKPTWGSRIFPSAQTAAETRAHRSLRRRYARRRWRLNLLQEIFASEMDKIDPEFFIRLNQSHLLADDREANHASYRWTLFNGSDFTERDYFKRFPTIYHLRQWLMDTNERADLRLIYLALHNIVKHRGNFLQQENKQLSSENANVKESVEEFCKLLQEYCDELCSDCGVEENTSQIVNALQDKDTMKGQIRDEIQDLIDIKPGDAFGDGLDKTAARNFAKAVAAAVLGYKAELANVFYVKQEKPEDSTTNIYLSDDEGVEAFKEICPDAGIPLFEAMLKVHSAFVLQEILSSKPGATLSANKVEDYERYGKDLRLLKDLVKEYAPREYDSFFRGVFYQPTDLHPQRHIYDKAKAKGYTRYNEIHASNSYDELKKEIEKLFVGTGAVEDDRYQRMMEAFREEKFLRRLKTSDNGAIPYQLHLEEMDKIVQNQARFYPFLATEKEKLDSLVEFRIPYYVGPLTQKNARTDASGVKRFAWAVRQEGMDAEPIKPWNWETIIDKDASATEFIQRMTGTCTYLHGEPVLPKNSLLYEEFCVLNELNGAHFSQDGDSEHRFDSHDRADMMHDLFQRKSVSYKNVENWMRQRGHSNVHVSGGQGEKGFESKLNSYIFFAKDIFNVDEIPESYYPMLEEIILWSTIFEDRTILKEKIEQKYGNCLNSVQIKKVVKKRFAGWGRLSKKMLTGITVQTDDGRRSVMDVLRGGNPNRTGKSYGNAMVFMEILHDDDLGFQATIDEMNISAMANAGTLSLEDLPGSPALRRGVNQSLGIVEEIVRIVGHAPNSIFVEVTRDEDARRKGRRTQKRYDHLREALEKLKEENPEFWEQEVSDDLATRMKQKDELDEKLTLYFMQGGKSLYSRKPIDITQLSSSRYHVDHIIPQSYIKDDSFENKALVLAGENEAKSDQMLIDESIRKKMRTYWDALKQAGLIGEKKHRNLLRSRINDKQLKGFIARQLVETSQIMKLVQSFLSDRYPETRVLSVKAGLSSSLRHRVGLPKCREINDFHHAHDALLASEIGRFIQYRHPGMYDNPIGYAHVMKAFIRDESQAVKQGKAPGTSPFVISSFLTSGVNKETGEIWDKDEEVARLKRYFDYRQCFISRMPEETSGAYWDQNPYSPRGGKKKPTVSLKHGLDPAKYGGYAGIEFAYFFIYRAKRKDRIVLELAPLPLYLASKSASSTKAIEDYARKLATEGGLEFIEVVRSKVLKYQRMEINGSTLFLTGIKEARNATQFATNIQETEIAAALFADEPLECDQLDELFMVLVQSLERYSPRLYALLKINEWRDRFFELDKKNRATVLKALTLSGNGKANMIDLTLVGGSKFAGNIQPNYSKTLTTGDGITFIDQSITGMFERRTHIGL